MICGVSGQDGAYLSRYLLEKGYEVIGTSRNEKLSSFDNLSRLGISDKVITETMMLSDIQSVLKILRKYNPTEIYNLAGQSSVGYSFDHPVETIQSIAIGTMNILEAMRLYAKPIRLFNAGSSECFGDAGGLSVIEESAFQPRSPYAVAKVMSHNLVANYREIYHIYGCTGILFNHESPLRADRFVTQKIIHAASKIATAGEGRLEIGNIDIHRDWGWAPEYVEAMWSMLQQSQAQDFIIATGRTVSLEYFIDCAFKCFDLDYKKYLVVNPDLSRPTDIKICAANPGRAKELLGWRAEISVETVIERMCSAARHKSIE